MRITTGGTQKESQIVELAPPKTNVLHYDVDYDSTKPEQTIRDFISDIKGMVSKYEYNKQRIFEIQNELEDLYHYIEISSYKTVPTGYKLYRKMAELRRERRACKNENDLLKPIYDYFHATEVLNKLSHVQGDCGICKETIDARTYAVRTDILDEWLEPQGTTVDVVTEEEPAGIDLSDNSWLPELEIDEPGTAPEASKKTETKPMSAFKQVWRAAAN